jgi:nucleotide-binding universal stress UspA family protein
VFERILLPVDLTERHVRAVQVAAGLAASAGGQVRVVHVIENIAGVSREEEPEFFNRVEAAARERLESLGALLQARGTRYTTEILYGNRAREILRLAEEWRIDLIVLASHRIAPGERPEGFGTLSHQLGIMAPCSVLLVK